MKNDTRNRVSRQFAPSAVQYVTSDIHARGDSLARLLALVNPQPGWRVLDVATGGGHTARTLAPHVALVVASDLTPAMLVAARQHLGEVGAANTAMCLHDSQQLPFASATFDGVTCRLAAHHFPKPLAFVQEAARVLRPGGVLAVTDNTASGEPQVARFVNTFETLRDPSHCWMYAVEDWQTFFISTGLEITGCETLEKELDFDEWAARMRVTGDDLTRLRALLVHAPAGARAWLKPRLSGSRLAFTLAETIIVGRKPGNG